LEGLKLDYHIGDPMVEQAKLDKVLNEEPW